MVTGHVLNSLGQIGRVHRHSNIIHQTAHIHRHIRRVNGEIVQRVRYG